MKMVSTKTEEKHADSVEYDGRPRLHLDDDMIEKLGIKGIPAPGTVFMLQAKAIAERVTAHAEEAEEVAVEGNKPDVSICLILAEIGLQPASTSSAEQASMLYGDEE